MNSFCPEAVSIIIIILQCAIFVWDIKIEPKNAQCKASLRFGKSEGFKYKLNSCCDSDNINIHCHTSHPVIIYIFTDRLYNSRRQVAKHRSNAVPKSRQACLFPANRQDSINPHAAIQTVKASRIQMSKHRTKVDQWG